MKHILVIICCVMFSACGASKGDVSEDLYEQITKSRFGDGGAYEVSPKETYLLCYKKVDGTAQQPLNSVSYVVIELKSNELIYKGEVSPGTVGWYDDTRLEIFYLPGSMPKDQDRDNFTEIYNLVTKETIKKSELVDRDD